MKKHTANATGNNNKALGQVDLLIEQYDDGRPLIVKYKGLSFFATGKTGTNIASGDRVYELGYEDSNTDQRVWVSSDFCNIYED